MSPCDVRRRPAPIAPVVWRDGVHLTGTPIWCDARRRRDVCFASAADRVTRGHGQLIGTPETLALVGERSDLAVPLRRRFTLGTLRLELVPSGRGLGGAALHVDVAGKTVLYAGVIRTALGGLGEPAEVRACDAVVVAAPFAAETFPPIDAVAADVRAWAAERLADHPVLVADTLLDAIEVASKIALPVTTSKLVRDAIERAKLPLQLVARKEPSVTIRVAGERARDPGPRAVVSGADGAAFPWSSAAGRKELAKWIDQTDQLFDVWYCTSQQSQVGENRARSTDAGR